MHLRYLSRFKLVDLQGVGPFTKKGINYQSCISAAINSYWSMLLEVNKIEAESVNRLRQTWDHINIPVLASYTYITLAFLSPTS